MLAAEKGDLEIVKELLNAKADTLITNKVGVYHILFLSQLFILRK